MRTRCAALPRPRRRPPPNRAPLRPPAPGAPLPPGEGRRTKRRAPSRTCWHNSSSTICNSDGHPPRPHRSSRLCGRRGGIPHLAGAAGRPAGPRGPPLAAGRGGGALRRLRGIAGHRRRRSRAFGLEGRAALQPARRGHGGRIPGARLPLRVAGRRRVRGPVHRGGDGAGAPGHVQRARHRAPGLPQPPALRARGRGGAGNGGARARLRARHSLPGKRKPDEEQAAREAVRAPALARADRSCRVPVGGVGIRFPLAGDRHRFAGVARGDRRDVPVHAQAGVRRPRLGAVRRPHPGAARRGLARAEGCVPGGRGIRAADRDVRWPALGCARAAGDGRMMLICVGLSHRQAPIAVRERVAVAPEQIEARLRQLKALPGVREALLLSTCNRVEIFAVAESRGAGEDLLQGLGPVAAPHAARRFEEDALRHLFRVAASLDSMVVGEAQILGQVKEAAAQAQQAGTLGPELSRALARATSAARRVRTETEIARGAISVSSVAVKLAHKLLGSLEDRSVLLLGAGEMAQLAAKELRSEGARELLVVKRSPQAAEELAREIGGVPSSLAELPALLERVDVAICSTAAAQAVVTRKMMVQAVKARRYRPIFLVDLTLPRNVEPAANELENVYVYDLDDLERVAAQNRDLRAAQVGRAEEIVEQELQAFLAQSRERTALPVLARLRAHADSVARAEVERTLAALQGLDEKQQKTVQAMAMAIVNKLLPAPTSRLRAEAGEGPLADAVAALFALEVEPPQPEKEAGQKTESAEEGTVLPLLRKS